MISPTMDPLAAAIHNDPHLRNGFYVFENRIYLSKIEALIEATKKGSDIEYYYNDHVYSAYDWSKEPVESLVGLYKKQAQHIRDRYDHVILMFSGGSDSTNMLDSFLSNGIHVDEVWSMVAFTNTCGKQNRSNIEITTSAWPILERASSLGVRVELVNLVDFDSTLTEDWWLDAAAARLAHDVMMRKNMFLNNPRLNALIDQGKRIAIVHGYDKPRLLIDGDQWCMGILDTFWAHHWKSQHTLNNGPFFEFFYYSPDLPEVLNKACHVLINHFERLWTADQCRRFFRSHNCRQGPTDIDLYRQQVNVALYNHCWDEFNTFSLGKNSGRWNQMNCQKCEFVIDHKTHWQNYQTWHQGIESLQQLIDPKFYVPWTQINGHWGRLYPIRQLRSSG